jgi:hypothetical protein
MALVGYGIHLAMHKLQCEAICISREGATRIGGSLSQSASSPMVEATVSKAVKCGFESHFAHVIKRCDFGYGAPTYFVGLAGNGEAIYECNCVVCNHCGHHTGNNTQGHWWSWCKATKTLEDFHYCCPGNCQLDEVEEWSPTHELSNLIKPGKANYLMGGCSTSGTAGDSHLSE